MRRGSCRSVWCLPGHHRSTWRLRIRGRRVWCLLTHCVYRLWVPTIWRAPAGDSTYLCRRCGEMWSRP